MFVYKIKILQKKGGKKSLQCCYAGLTPHAEVARNDAG